MKGRQGTGCSEVSSRLPSLYIYGAFLPYHGKATSEARVRIEMLTYVKGPKATPSAICMKLIDAVCWLVLYVHMVKPQ